LPVTNKKTTEPTSATQTRGRAASPAASTSQRPTV
jgi:hypothetical protein